MNKITKISFEWLCLLGLLVCGTAAMAAEPQLPDSLNVGYNISVSKAAGSYSIEGVGASALDKSPYIDVTKALYGKIAGLNVYQGSGASPDNVSSLSIHGKTPLVLVDGFPRDIEDITAYEIESIYILKDAAAAALYGIRGANGVVMVTTRRGNNSKLNVNMQYDMGVNTQFRAPRFADSYTYAQAQNQALVNDGLAPRYNTHELEAFRTGLYPYEYPNVDWWKETMNKTGLTHNLKFSFNGGNERFRYHTVVDYYRDKSMLKKNENDDRFNTNPTDTRLSVRANIDVNVTKTTYMKVGLAGKLMETIETRYGRDNIFMQIYGTNSAAFPIRYANGIYGGNDIYTDGGNPFMLLTDYGAFRTMQSKLMADLSLRQNLDIVTRGLSAEIQVAFDNAGVMYDPSRKTNRYMNANASISDDGTLITTPLITGTDGATIDKSGPGVVRSIMMRSDFQAKIDYARTFGKHAVTAAVIYDMQATVRNGRNTNRKYQTMLVNASYSYDNRYTVNAVFNRSGSNVMPDGAKFSNYPAVSAAWIISNESFMAGSAVNELKLRASYGLSGYEGSFAHELWRYNYTTGNNYLFGSADNQGAVSGSTEASLPVVGLVPERSEKTTVGLDFAAFGNRLTASVEGFFDKQSNILVPASNSTSGIIGIGVGSTNAGIYKYRGVDAAIHWQQQLGDFGYGLGATMSYLSTEVVNDNQAYQEYQYLYHAGNPVGQCYGLEAIGFFTDQQDINNSPMQTFSDVRPGDVKYKDQNGDNRIDDKDMVRMFGSSTMPRFYFGFNVEFSYKGFELSADFQGLTGKTVNLLNSPLYQPLVNNGNISQTFLDREICWTPERAADATMPRLTTQNNANNYRASSLWYRDGSFLKLRNLTLAYTFPKAQTHFADLKIYLRGTNLFSADNLGFADPEMLGYGYPSTRSYWVGVKFNF